MTTKALATQEAQLAAPPIPQPSVAGMLQAVIDKGITHENVAVMEQLVGLYERMQAKDAERSFNAAMLKLKDAMPAIQACKGVPNKQGVIMYKYAPLQEIDEKLSAVARQHGFTYSFAEQPADAGKVTKVCVVKHIDGHTERTPFTVRVGHGPPNSSEAQGDGAAASYAQRRALCDAFGIIVEADKDGADDAMTEGKPITQEQADGLRDLCDEAKADRKKFLTAANVQQFEEIMSANYENLRGMLERRIKSQRETA